MNKELAWKVFEELKKSGADIGNASVNIIYKAIKEHGGPTPTELREMSGLDDVNDDMFDASILDVREINMLHADGTLAGYVPIKFAKRMINIGLARIESYDTVVYLDK